MYQLAEDAIRTLERRPGAYALWAKFGDVWQPYVGRAKCLPERLSNHLAANESDRSLKMAGPSLFGFEYAQDEMEACKLEQIWYHQLLERGYTPINRVHPAPLVSGQPCPECPDGLPRRAVATGPGLAVPAVVFPSPMAVATGRGAAAPAGVSPPPQMAVATERGAVATAVVSPPGTPRPPWDWRGGG